MKQNLRKVLAMLVLSTSVMGLTACGEADTEAGVTYDEAYLHSVADFLITNWDGLDEATLTGYASMDAEEAAEVIEYNGLPFTAEAFTTAFAGYQGSVDELGAYISTDSYDAPIVKGDEVTLNVNVTYEQRPAQISIVFNKKSVAESVAINPEYTIGEILAKAGMNTLIGMGVVFAVLIFLSLLISCFNFIPKLQKMFSKYGLSRDELIRFTLAAYNAGEGNVAEWLENDKYSDGKGNLVNIPFKETAHYVKKVNDNIEIYKKLYYKNNEGVTEIDCSNKPFDANFCNALLTEKVEDVEPNTVIEVLQKGYILKDRLLRAALVKVSE